MNDIVALFDANKIKRIEFYRSEMFGNDNEEIWCEIDLLGTGSHKMTLYRKGYTVTSNEDRLDETALPCFLNGREFTFRTSLFKETKTKVCDTMVSQLQVRRLIQSVSISIDVMQSLKEFHPPMEPSQYYPERKVKCNTDKNKVKLEFANGTTELIEMHLDSDARMCWSEGLKIIPQLYRGFIGPYAIKKISKKHLRNTELKEFNFMCECTLYTEKDIEFLLEHLFRDEQGYAYYATPQGLAFFKLYGVK